MYFLYYTCAEKLRLSSEAGKVYSLFTLVLKSCDFRARVASQHVLPLPHLYSERERGREREREREREKMSEEAERARETHISLLQC